MRNHTGTHLLHRALRNVVGDTARQAGSLVHPDYLRFDYPFDRSLTEDEKRAIEDEVRAIVRDDRPVTVEYLPMAEAIERRRCVLRREIRRDRPDRPREGLQLRAVRRHALSCDRPIGGFAITGERSTASGQRRIEALTGAGADRFVRERLDTLDRVADVGAQSVDRVDEWSARSSRTCARRRRRSREGGGGVPRPAELGRAGRGGRAVRGERSSQRSRTSRWMR